jgi:hypothetical protein
MFVSVAAKGPKIVRHPDNPNLFIVDKEADPLLAEAFERAFSTKKGVLDEVIQEQSELSYLDGFSRKPTTRMVGRAKVILRLTNTDYMLGKDKTRVQPSRNPSMPIIQAAPGYRLDHFLKGVFSKKSYERVFSQVIIDTREEYIEAIAAGAERHARWIKFRCYLLVIWVALLQMPAALVAAVVRKLGGS